MSDRWAKRNKLELNLQSNTNSLKMFHNHKPLAKFVNVLKILLSTVDSLKLFMAKWFMILVKIVIVLSHHPLDNSLR